MRKNLTGYKTSWKILFIGLLSFYLNNVKSINAAHTYSLPIIKGMVTDENGNPSSLYPVYMLEVKEFNTFFIEEIILSENPDTVIIDLPDPNISGFVKNSNGEPIANAKVIAINTAQLKWNPWIGVSNFWAEYTAVTDTNGFYALHNIRPDGYVLFAGTDYESYIATFYPNTMSISKAEIITIVDANTVKTADFTLVQGAEVIGFVKDELGKGLAGIRVSLWRDDEDMKIQNIFYETQTDINGKFIFKGIPGGTWHTGAWDQEDIFLIVENQYEEIITAGTATTFLKNNIIMKAGGSLQGNYLAPINDTIFPHHLGRLFIYPDDLTELDSLNSNEYDEWSHVHVSIKMADTVGRYRTDAIPAGKWRMVISPEPAFDMNISDIPITQNFIPSLRWSYIDHASTLENSNCITIIPYKKTDYDLNFEAGGHIVFGTIRSENNDILGSFGKHFRVRVCVKENNRFIQISESFEIGENRFALPGLVDGEQYYFNSHANEYPDQWWISIPESTTCIKEHAKPYTFSTTNFAPLTIYLMEKPEGWDEWEEGASYIKNFKIIPAGLTSFNLTWSPSLPEENVVRYNIFRLKNATEDLFELNEWGWWEPVIEEDSIMKLVDSFSVTDTFFVDNSAIPFIQYMYVVFAVDAKGREGKALPGHIPLSAYFSKISYESFQNATSVKPNIWQMVGICGLDSLKLGNRDNTSEILKIYHWDETSDSSKLYSHYVPVSSVNPGQGIWIYSSTTDSLSMTESGFNELVKKKNSIAINMNEGWNQISSPFPYEVAPSWLVQKYIAWEWIAEENKYVEAKAFKPWKAYWIESGSITSISIAPTPSVAAKRTLNPLTRNAGWELKVSLTGESSSDPDNFIGTLPHELAKILSNTSTEPPPAFDFPHLYFVNGTKKLAKQYAFSSSIPAKKIEWKVGISPSEETMTVKIHDLSSIPDEVSLFWIDNSKTINLRKNNTVSVDAHSETRYGYIIATANAADIALYTGKFMLKPNFPNPFSRITTIGFTVPYIWNKDGSKESGNKQKVSLSIYNMSGQLIATLFSGYAKVGHHRKVWNGKSNSGRIIPSGMYIARLKSRSFSKSMRLIKVK